MLLLGDLFPNFTAVTTDGEIEFYEWLGNSWGILFSHPSDFTPVCTTELARMLKLMPEFTKRNTKVIGLSCDSITSYIESEILRVLDSLQLTDKGKVATPVDWKMGDECMVLPTVPEDQIAKVFPQGVTVVPLPSGKNYLRKTACPKFQGQLKV